MAGPVRNYNTSTTSGTDVEVPIVGIAVPGAGGPVALGSGQSGQSGLPIASVGYASTQSITRANTTPTYSAGQVVGPTAAAITFSNVGPSAGGEVLITSATFERDASALISGETSYTLHLYNVTPPSALADAAAWDLPAGDRTAYLGSISLGTPVDLGSTLYVAIDSINKQVTLLSSSMFGYLVTNGGYTAVAQAVHRIGLHTAGV